MVDEPQNKGFIAFLPNLVLGDLIRKVSKGA